MKEYIEKNYYSAHMPGHKSGMFLPTDIKELFGEKVFQFDITETMGMDNLQNPQGIIKDTETKISRITGAKKANLLVNGSTAGILAAVFTLARDKKIFVGSNCHQSVYNAMIISGAKPIFLTPELDQENGVELGVSPETLTEGIEENPDCKVLILTFPNYYGIRYKYKEIFRIAKANNLQIIIDEAHGAHFNFMKDKYPNAVSLGADVAVQSWHKTLPVLNQGSVLLEGFGKEAYNFRESINVFQTTSPSYLIMSSIDAAADFLEGKETEVISNAGKWQKYFKELKLLNLVILRYLEEESDPFKLVVLSKKESGKLLWEIVIDKYKIQPEIIESGRLLFMLPLFFDSELAERIKNALIDLDNNLEEKKNLEKYKEPERKKIVSFKKNPQEMSYLQKEKVSLNDSLGKICAQKIVMYPPGVPLIYPGEVLREEIVCYLQRHKINYNLQEGIEIFTDQENKKCVEYS
jgi:arginine/lysine/ornithine decarboxylase